MPADNGAHLSAAAARRREQTLQRARDALRQLEADGGPVTFDLVAPRCRRLSDDSAQEFSHPRTVRAELGAVLRTDGPPHPWPPMLPPRRFGDAAPVVLWRLASC